jgi:hypothetical protein
MTLDVIYEALRRESDLVREQLGFGATAIGRARFESPGLYAPALFALSIGLKQGAELALTLDAAASELWSSAVLRVRGHPRCWSETEVARRRTWCGYRFRVWLARRHASAMARGCRVITVSSGGFKTILGWLRTSLVVIVISRSCCRLM